MNGTRKAIVTAGVLLSLGIGGGFTLRDHAGLPARVKAVETSVDTLEETQEQLGDKMDAMICLQLLPESGDPLECVR